MVTQIVIPVRDQLQYTQSIVKQLKTMDGWDHCWIFDNGSIDDTWFWLKGWVRENPRFSVLSAEGKTIYEMWDWGFYTSRLADHILFLNNDIEMEPETITALNTALDSADDIWIAYPDYSSNIKMNHLCNYKTTHGTFRHGGMSGFCFMIKRRKIDWEPLVDPGFKLWYGDDDVAFEVEARGGRQVRVIGLPIHHVQSATVNQHPELLELIPSDRERFIEKWGENR